MLSFMLHHVGAGNPALYRLRLGAKLVVTGGKGIQQGLLSHCLTTARMAERFGLDDDQVCRPLQQVFARWDGKGMPQGMGGEDISLPMRLFHLADMVEVHHRTDGPDAAVEVAQAKRGKQFDPAVVDAFCQVAAEVLGDPAEEHDWPALIASEPSLQRRLTEDELDAALEAIADFTDLRSAPRSGHSRAVADLAERAAVELGLPATDVAAVRRAALLHDIGMHGVPANILDKPTPLSSADAERLRMHPYYTQRMLAQPEALARLGAIASLACERADGSGYHRGMSVPAIPVAGRVLAAACALRR
jgi:HD-GYP domain-containing protein (c-di-GMP phosphodiesterase class II)